jgi:DNA invertase Pin-like site-specific DNA recombinase
MRLRRREGLAAAVAAGHTLGRQPGPPLPTQQQHELARQLRDSGLSVAEIADLIGVSRTTLYRALQPDDVPTTDEESAP